MTTSIYRGRLLPSAFAVLLLVLGACDQREERLYQGYVEGDFVYVSTPLSGELTMLDVERGRRVRAGEPLFSLEKDFEQAAAFEAAAEVRRAEQILADLKKGSRPTELAALRANLQSAVERRSLSRAEFLRRDALFKERHISKEEFEEARTAWRRDRAEVERIENELATARLGGREDAVEAAAAAAAAARHGLEQARWRLSRKSRSAPSDGLVFDTFYEVGEQVPEGRPVVSLLPPENIKIRFFVPEPVVGTLSLGRRVRVFFDGAKRDHTATIRFISPEAEYTPPVIFSRQTRAKLVFLVEAYPDKGEASTFHPGQPVDVRIEGPVE
ncbi:HlyD family secretion protein [Desulfuromonas sp. TF]|uniref:HlyD family secretion protein n=1 Tax=Desulfuromonas sp. TF TaxID=1232410 RepID=UPI000413C95E|nr:HlyD family efflux transporter periplasmic adaptor subunit [Desulfuromonas sp. TF]